jgi:hypothetical protein
MSGLLLGMVLSVWSCWFYSMVTLPFWPVSTDFGTCSYQCFLSNCTPVSLHMLKCSCAHTHYRFFLCTVLLPVWGMPLLLLLLLLLLLFVLFVFIGTLWKLLIKKALQVKLLETNNCYGSCLFYASVLHCRCRPYAVTPSLSVPVLIRSNKAQSMAVRTLLPDFGTSFILNFS